MSSATLQFFLAVLLLVALVILILTGHSADQNTGVIAGGLGIAIGFFFRSAISAFNHAKEDTEL